MNHQVQAKGDTTHIKSEEEEKATDNGNASPNDNTRTPPQLVNDNEKKVEETR